VTWFDDVKALAKRAAQARRARMDDAGLPDPRRAQEAAITWALLRNDLAERCTATLAAGDVVLAQRHARRWRAADDRAREAQARGEQLERELSAALRGLQ
jgi:hypothetical protein